MGTIVEISKVSFSFETNEGRTDIFDSIDLSIAEREIVVILGMSGVGKSTLLRLVCGLLMPDSGDITVHSRNREELFRPFGFVFQDSRLLFWRRVLRNVTFGLEGLAMSRNERINRAQHVLQLVGLGDSSHKWPYQLSGGQRQRVGIARALAVEPDVLLMDEPLNSLDEVTNKTLQRELIRIWHATHVSMLYVTHNIHEALYLADRILVFSGRPAHIVSEYTLVTPREEREDAPEIMNIQQLIQQDLRESAL